MIFKNAFVVSLFAVLSVGCQCGPQPLNTSDGGGSVDAGSTAPTDAGGAIDSGTTVTCPTGFTSCSGVCVDLSLDNAHCGSCTRACPSGEGCVANSCVPSLTLDAGPATCPASGSPILVTVPDAGSLCTGLLAQTTFRWGLCACNQISLSGNLETDAFDSASGAYVPGIGGSVGTNGAFISQATNRVGGSLWSSSDAGLGVTGTCEARQELRVGGSLASSAPFKVGLDAFVNGNVVVSGAMTVGQVLHVPQAATVSSQVAAASTVRGPVNVSAPCDCSESQIIPVAAIVAARKANNDNATIGLNADALSAVSAPKRLDLPCGHYYLSRLAASAPVTIVAHGRTILYIDGNIAAQGALSIAADVGAELDVFVAGTIVSSAAIRLGNPLAPARTRVYLASAENLGISASLQLGAFLYAPKTAISASGKVEAFGGIVSGSYQSSADTVLHYDLAVLKLAQECAPADAGVDVPKACTTCGDCANQACIGGTCGACVTNSDCCAPLLCASGKCVGIY